MRPVGEVKQVLDSSPAHVGDFRYAVDLVVDDPRVKKTIVTAPISGVIEDVVMGNTEWGPSEAFKYKVNYITIRPDSTNLEFVQLAHLSPLLNDSGEMMNLKLKDRIIVGQPIATVGLNGWITNDESGNPISHLHVLVGQWKDGLRRDFKGLKIRWA